MDSWIAATGESALLDRLADADRAHCNRAARATVRQERIVAWALLRLGLARFLTVESPAVEIVTGPLGRRQLGGAFAGALDFNITHSRGVAAVAFARRRAVGIDVEDTSRTVGAAEEVLSASEQALLRAAGPAVRRELFFRLWTIKEAYAKAHGLGLTIGFSRFAVDLSSGGPALLDPRPTADDAPVWQILEWEVPPAHRLALVLERREREEPVVVQCAEAHPDDLF